jgi:hypothetical protein
MIFSLFWVHALKTKDEVFGKSREFKSLVKKQSNRKIMKSISTLMVEVNILAMFSNRFSYLKASPEQSIVP